MLNIKKYFNAAKNSYEFKTHSIVYYANNDWLVDCKQSGKLAIYKGSLNACLGYVRKHAKEV